MISHEHRFIFYHVPRTGGTSIEYAFPRARRRSEAELRRLAFAPNPFGGPTSLVTRRRGSIWHMTAADYAANYDAELLARYFSFAFVRNPWDLMVSFFFWRRIRPGYGAPRDHDDPRGAFKRWLKRRLAAEPDFFPPQTSYFLIDGRCQVDFIGRFETLAADFAHVCRTIGVEPPALERLNLMPRGHYADYHDEETRRLVAERFAVEIDYLGYEFDEEDARAPDDRRGRHTPPPDDAAAPQLRVVRIRIQMSNGETHTLDLPSNSPSLVRLFATLARPVADAADARETRIDLPGGDARGPLSLSSADIAAVVTEPPVLIDGA